MKNNVIEQKEKEGELLLGTYDCIFKGLLLDPNNLDYIKGYIHFIMNIPYEYLNNIRIENSEYIIDNKNDKNMRSDIIVSIENLLINIEMDKDYYDSITKKDNAYYHKLSSTTYDLGEDYSNSKIIVQIVFQDFYYFENNQEIYKFVYKEEKTNERLYEEGKELEIKYFVNLAYIYDSCYNKDVNELSEFERYCLLLKTTDKDKAYEISGDDKVMKKVNERLETLSSDKKVIGLYNAQKEEEKVRNTIEKDAEKKGIKQGREEGIKQGREEEKNSIAKNLLKETKDLKFISRVTGLSLEEIERLKD